MAAVAGEVAVYWRSSIAVWGKRVRGPGMSAMKYFIIIASFINQVRKNMLFDTDGG
jgi:hypothetical protein